jgi:SSS family solute:Na+ symporter
LSAKTDQSAARASLLGISLTVPIWTIFMLIGTTLFVFFKQNPLPPGMKAEAVFPHFIITQLPIGLIGFIVAALISAAICSLSADLNALAAVGIEDYYKKIRPGKADKEYLQMSKSFIVFSGILSMAIGALYILSGNEGVLGIIFTIYAIFSGGIVGIFLLGLFSARTNWQGLNIGIVACVLFTAWALLTSTPMGANNPSPILDLGSFNFIHHKLMLGVYSHLVVIVVGYCASLFFPKPILEPNLLYSNWKQNRHL